MLAWQLPLAPHCDSVSPQQVSPAVAQWLPLQLGTMAQPTSAASSPAQAQGPAQKAPSEAACRAASRRSRLLAERAALSGTTALPYNSIKGSVRRPGPPTVLHGRQAGAPVGGGHAAAARQRRVVGGGGGQHGFVVGGGGDQAARRVRQAAPAGGVGAAGVADLPALAAHLAAALALQAGGGARSSSGTSHTHGSRSAGAAAGAPWPHTHRCKPCGRRLPMPAPPPQPRRPTWLLAARHSVSENSPWASKAARQQVSGSVHSAGDGAALAWPLVAILAAARILEGSCSTTLVGAAPVHAFFHMQRPLRLWLLHTSSPIMVRSAHICHSAGLMQIWPCPLPAGAGARHGARRVSALLEALEASGGAACAHARPTQRRRCGTHQR
jgi:hypothetical protein